MQRAARWHRPVAATTVLATVVLLGLGLQGVGPQGTAAAGTPSRAVGTAKKPAPAPAAPRPANGAGTANGIRHLCATARVGKARCLSLALTGVRTHKGVAPNDTPAGYGPTDLTEAYNLTSTGSSAETIGIVDAFDDVNAEADLAVYRQQYGLPACSTANGCFKKVAQDGSSNYPPPPPPGDDWTGEISLDLDMASAICPSCHIVLVEATDNSLDNLGASVNQAVAQGALFVSNSYGGSEDPSELASDTQYYKHQGVVITASSGDGGYGVEYPAASPWVTSVGGTSLVRDSSPRGWGETVWNNSYGAPGSGCSDYEPKPAFQTDTGCANRTVADVSADADPLTGVAVYDTANGNTGWGQYGGTSVASPVIAGVYALAGKPGASDFPNSYPYATPTGLNDVTEGNDGTCSPDYLCTAGTGYDGPTGLGTPNGTLSFAPPGPRGDIAGTVTDSASNQPIAGATVTAGDATATTAADGTYDLSVPTGSYDVTASAFGYGSATRSGVVVTDGNTTTADFALAPAPRVTLTGTVTDGSGHGWPLYAKITVNGTPLAPIYTSPFTGRYSVEVPASATYSLHVESQYTGYNPADVTVRVGRGDTHKDVALRVDKSSCSAAGYQTNYTGLGPVTFDDANAPPAGWTVSNTPDSVGGWEFDDPGARGNQTGGDGNFAIVDSDYLGIGNSQDTSLITPVIDLSAQSSPQIYFDTYYYGFFGQVGDIDVTTDGGATWKTVWEQTTDSVTGPQQVDISSVAANKSAVQIRFHFTATWGEYWELDNVFVGTASCVKTHGGLVVGRVVDANTNQGVNGATVASVEKPAQTTVSVATPNDKALGDGFYHLFSSLTGGHRFVASHGGYASQVKRVNVQTDYVTPARFTLGAGRLAVTPGAITQTVKMGRTATANLTLTNTGTAPANVKVTEQPGGFTLLGQHGVATGPAVARIKATLSLRARLPAGSAGAKAKPYGSAAPADAPWVNLPDYPTPILDDKAAAGDDGKVYVVGGTQAGLGPTAASNVYDPSTQAWSPIADLPTAVQEPGIGFINGKLIVATGVGADVVTNTQIYDPSSDAWSAGAAIPAAVWAPGSAVLNGRLYVVAGCGSGDCTAASKSAYAYDPSSDSWTQIADYPDAVAFLSCGGIDGQLVCAGGVDPNTSVGSTGTYTYDPGADSWTKDADLPAGLWASAYLAANGQLLVSGGAAPDGTITNEGYAFDPVANAWSDLPASNNSVYRGAGACGFDKLGGSTGGFSGSAVSEQLPGYTDCGGNADVGWLSEDPTQATVAPGQSVTITVTLDASDLSVVSQPGTYTARLGFTTDTPYTVAPVPVTMNATPPATWGKVTGTVNALDCTGNPTPLPGATVEVDSFAQSFTLKTDKSGGYGLWLDVRNNPLTMIVAKDGYKPQTRQVRIARGTTTTVNYSLQPASGC